MLAALTVVRLAVLAWGGLDLSPDEAHYWEWSRRLDLSYYSKGPLIAYLIAALTGVLGTTALAIRLGAVVLSVLGSWALFRLGRELYGDPRPGALAVIGLQCTPLVWAGSLLMTIDAPFMALWTLALLAGHRALHRGRPVDWVLLGAAVGTGLLAKYTMLFVVPGLALYAWRTPAARRALRGPGPLAGAAVALALFAPVLLWNARVGWVSARHVASQGRGGGLGWLHLVELIGSQLVVLSPVVAALVAWALWRGVGEGLVRGREPYRFLAAMGAPVIGFHLLLALQGKVQANWPAAAYPPLALLGAGLIMARRGALDAGGRRRQAWLLAAAGLVALVLSVAGHLTPWLGLPPRLDPTARLRGWAELGAAAARLRSAMPRPGSTFLLSSRYQIASELAFYVPGHPPAYNLNLGRRLNQYDLWDGPETRLGWDAIYVEEGSRPLDDRVAQAFEHVEPPVVLEIRRSGRVTRTFVLHRAHGFRGVPSPTGPPRF